MGWLLLSLLASTPGIDAFMTACERPVERFRLPRRGAVARALGAGVVSEASDSRVVVSHCFIENHQPRTVRFVVEPLERVDVREGDAVTAGQVLGRGRKARAQVDGETAAAFVVKRRRLLAPAARPVLLVVDVDGHRAVRFEYGRPTHEWEMAHGQAEGVKAERGDLKTPRGLYDVVSTSLGPFSGDSADFYGGVWLKLNYPNAFDAARGLEAGLVSRDVAEAIMRAWVRRMATPQRTRLGGGIGFHGWASEWSGDDGWGLSWGCLVLHPEEARGFHDVVPLGTPVVLL